MLFEILTGSRWNFCCTRTQETASATKNVKAAKAKEAELRSQGIAGAHAGRIASALVSGVKNKKQKGKRQRAAAEKWSAGGLSPLGWCLFDLLSWPPAAIRDSSAEMIGSVALDLQATTKARSMLA